MYTCISISSKECNYYKKNKYLYMYINSKYYKQVIRVQY